MMVGVMGVVVDVVTWTIVHSVTWTVSGAMSPCIGTYTYIYIYTYARRHTTHTHTHTHTHTSARALTHTRTHTHHMQAHTHVRTHAYIHTQYRHKRLALYRCIGLTRKLSPVLKTFPEVSPVRCYAGTRFMSFLLFFVILYFTRSDTVPKCV